MIRTTHTDGTQHRNPGSSGLSLPRGQLRALHTLQYTSTPQHATMLQAYPRQNTPLMPHAQSTTHMTMTYNELSDVMLGAALAATPAIPPKSLPQYSTTRLWACRRRACRVCMVHTAASGCNMSWERETHARQTLRPRKQYWASTAANTHRKHQIGAHASWVRPIQSQAHAYEYRGLLLHDDAGSIRRAPTPEPTTPR